MELTDGERKLVLDTIVSVSGKGSAFAEKVLTKVTNLIDVLGITEKRGFYRTGYGKKTKVGLILTIVNIIG